MNKRHELLREASANLRAFSYDEKQAITDTIEIEDALVKALEAAKEKLVLYRATHSGEYIGGMEYAALMALLDAVFAKAKVSA